MGVKILLVGDKMEQESICNNTVWVEIRAYENNKFYDNNTLFFLFWIWKLVTKKVEK